MTDPVNRSTLASSNLSSSLSDQVCDIGLRWCVGCKFFSIAMVAITTTVFAALGRLAQ